MLDPHLAPAAAAALVLALAVPTFAASQEPGGSDRPVAPALRVTTSLPEEGFVDADTPVEISVEGEPGAGVRLAVWVGDVDVTGLTRPTPRGLRYEPGPVPLPSGTHDLRVFRVGAEGRWEELAAVPLRVRGPLGFESSTWSPRLSAGVDGQVAQGHTPAEAAPDRTTFQDVEGDLVLDTEHVHRSYTLAGAAELFGTSRREKALRFRDEGERAPRIDLAEYELRVDRGGSSLTVGHLRTGEHRHLVDGLRSRGAELAVEAGRRVHLSTAVTGGSRMVGWDRPLGLSEPDDRVWNATLGVEAVPTPGALRFDLTVMGGSVLPDAGFNRDAVVDAETSRGVGVRMRARALDRRLEVDAGFARSSFDNPDDPGLEQGRELVEVERTSGDARYLDASLDVLRDLAVGGRTAALSVGFRHERVDPLYRSVGARVRADNLDNRVDLRMEVADVGLTVSWASAEDNLGEVASILTSHTDRTGLTAGLPLDRIVGSTSSWLPRVQLRLDRTHQFGEGVPENGGFDPSHVPDQISTRRSAAVDWRWSEVTLGYRWDASDQDNRQEGREDADLEGSSHSVSVGLTPWRFLTASLDAGLERAENLEREEVDDTRSLGARVEWRPFDASTLSLRWSWTGSRDEADTRERTTRTLDVQLASAVPGLQRLDGQGFVRFSRRESERSDLALELDDRRELWTVSTGMSLTLQRR